MSYDLIILTTSNMDGISSEHVKMYINKYNISPEMYVCLHTTKHFQT